MATQNAYNNYIKRKTQTTQPINNFKEKVKNSLGGVPVSNTQTTPNTNATTPSTSYSKPVQATPSINTPKQRTIGSTTPTTPQNTQPTITPQTTTTQPTTQTVAPQQVQAQPTQPITDAASNTGLMSLSEINNAYNTSTEEVNAISTPISSEEIQDVANSPMVRSMARSTNKTPQQMAQELLEEQKAQLQKDYELKQQEINLQKEQAQNSFNQSKVDAENAYNESIDKINQDRYNRQQELNTSGSRRGIQYSAQQLGLENVANINTNKNITEAGKQRNELLNKLQQQLNELNATLHLSSQQALNDYNKNLADINADYANKIMNWEREDSQIASDRAWQEQQTAADRAWQEKVEREQREWEAEQERLQREWEAQQEALNRDWQSNENKLDRDKYGRSSGGYSSGSYSSGYDGYSSGARNYSRSSYTSNNYNTDDEITQQTIDNDFKKLSTDAYNAVDTGGVYDLMERASLYDEFISPMYDEYYGQNDIVDERLDNTRETALKHLYNKSYARSTNGSYNIGNTVYQHKSPLRQDYIDKVKSERYKTQADYYNRFSNNEATKRRANHYARTESLHNSIMESAKKSSTSKTNASNELKNSTTKKTQITNNIKSKLESNAKKNSSNKNNSKTQSKVSKSISNAKKNSKTSATKATQNTKKATTNAKNNTKTSVKKAVQNNKKSTTNAKNNVKTSVKKATQNTKKSTSNASKNFKNNVKKAVSKIFKKK